jgi:uncharacterized membrane protein YfcA
LARGGRRWCCGARSSAKGALAYIAGGLDGVPIGLGLLQALLSRTFAGGLGLFLIVYSVLVLLKPDSVRIKLSGWNRPWEWASPEESSVGFLLSQVRCRWSIWGCAA